MDPSDKQMVDSDSSSGSYHSDGPVFCFNPYKLDYADHDKDGDHGAPSESPHCEYASFSIMNTRPNDHSNVPERGLPDEESSTSESTESSPQNSYSSDGPISCFNPFEKDNCQNEKDEITLGEDGDSYESSPRSSYSSDGPVLCFNPYAANVRADKEDAQHFQKQNITAVHKQNLPLVSFPQQNKREDTDEAVSESSHSNSYSSDGPISCFNPYSNDHQELSGSKIPSKSMDQNQKDPKHRDVSSNVHFKTTAKGDNLQEGSWIHQLSSSAAIKEHAGVLPPDLLDLKIEDTKQVFVETESYRKVRQILQKFGYVTITGAAGEGKTAMALMLGVEYRQQGYQMVMVEDVVHFNVRYLLESKFPSFVIVDDIFGSVGLRTCIKHLEQLLHHFVLLTKPKKAASSTINTLQETAIIFTTKIYNLKEGLLRMGGDARFPFFMGETTLDLSSPESYYSVQERSEIFEKHRSSHGRGATSERIDICNPKFGFPLICKMYFDIGTSEWANLTYPLVFLKRELSKLLNEQSSRSAVLILMLLCEDKLNLADLEAWSGDEGFKKKLRVVSDLFQDITHTDISLSAKSLRGTFFTDRDITGFSHPIMYDACAVALAKLNIVFVLQHCSLKFLYERVHPRWNAASWISDENNIIYISDAYHKHLVSRLVQGIEEKQYALALTNPVLKIPTIGDEVIQQLFGEVGDIANKDENLTFFRKHCQREILYWVAHGHNLRLFEGFLRHCPNIDDNDLDAVLKASVSCGNQAVLEVVLSQYGCQITENMMCEAFLSAAQNEHQSISEVLLGFVKGNPSIKKTPKLLASITEEDIQPEVSDFLTLTQALGCEGITDLLKIAAQSGEDKAFQWLLKINSVFKEEIATITLEDSTLIHRACQGGSTFIVTELLPYLSINSRSENNWTPIMSAVYSDKKEVFDLLFKNGADLKLEDNCGNTVLHLACRGGNRSIVEQLLPIFDINSPGEHGWTPIMNASHCSKTEVFDLLVSKGADLTLNDVYGDSLIHIASEGGNTSITGRLLSLLLFDIDSRGEHGWTPIMKAAIKNKSQVFDLLWDKGADIMLTDYSGDTLLHLACQGGNVQLVERILPRIDLNCRGEHGWTPVMNAAISCKKDVFDLLCLSGADLQIKDTYGDSLLHLACQGGNTAIIQDLLPLFDINIHGCNEWTPVMKAAYHGQKDAFELLESKGADQMATDNDGYTILHLACRGGNTAIVSKVMLLYNINVKGWNGHTPLMRAVCGGNTEVFDLLLRNDADATLLDYDGDNLLHLACEKDNLKMVKCVLPYVDRDLRDKLGQTPLMLALLFGQTKVFKYLSDDDTDLTLVDNIGDDMLTLAYRGGCTEIIKQLTPPDEEVKDIKKWTDLMKYLVYGHWEVFRDYEQGNPELVQRDGFGDTLLHIACRGGNMRCVEHLLPSYDINVRGRFGWTPAMMAARCGHLDIFQCLTSHKADLSLFSDTGENVLSLARRGPNTDIVAYLMTLPDFTDTE